MGVVNRSGPGHKCTHRFLTYATTTVRKNTKLNTVVYHENVANSISKSVLRTSWPHTYTQRKGGGGGFGKGSPVSNCMVKEGVLLGLKAHMRAYKRLGTVCYGAPYLHESHERKLCKACMVLHWFYFTIPASLFCG